MLLSLWGHLTPLNWNHGCPCLLFLLSSSRGGILEFDGSLKMNNLVLGKGRFLGVLLPADQRLEWGLSCHGDEEDLLPHQAQTNSLIVLRTFRGLGIKISVQNKCLFKGQGP